ncbi:CHC2 zinc finger domain-containing protein [Crossiella sp. S99.2]|nr:CHC2 zinc finger domain-containing protein [Crossiella sp. S99.2]MCK2245207.1 CHC2 zinc finger domain-containing protein [Crossiella sp. S99.2]MCK2258871.1 CHC2 zinc finger domain-containing protein [Crossiella sp. S99.1]
MARTALPAPEPPGSQGIADLIEQHTTLRPTVHGQLQGDCPFCNSTAFVVRPAHGTYHCFGCGDGGDSRAFATKVQRDV